MPKLIDRRVLISRVAVTAKTVLCCTENQINKKTFIETKARFYNVILADYNCFMCFKSCALKKYHQNNKKLS